MQENVVKITFADATVDAQKALSQNTMVSSLQIDHASGNTYVTITPKEGVTLWGYDVEYRHNDTEITLKQAPTLSDIEGKPLTGISVMVDAGHGGDDPGALGAAGNNGPAEAMLNLAIAQQLKAQLENLGATVYMVRENDQWVTLIDRLGFEAALKPISLWQSTKTRWTIRPITARLKVWRFTTLMKTPNNMPRTLQTPWEKPPSATTRAKSTRIFM